MYSSSNQWLKFKHLKQGIHMHWDGRSIIKIDTSLAGKRLLCHFIPILCTKLEKQFSKIGLRGKALPIGRHLLRTPPRSMIQQRFLGLPLTFSSTQKVNSFSRDGRRPTPLLSSALFFFFFERGRGLERPREFIHHW
jgi:hypothetical protein